MDPFEKLAPEVRETVYEALVVGAATLLPIAVTLMVLGMALDFVRHQLRRVSVMAIQIPGVNSLITRFEVVSWLLFQLLVPVVLLATILVTGLIVSRSYHAERAVNSFDAFVTAIPGVGTVYESFRSLSDSIVESDTDNFRDVKLVEFPHEGAYTLGFVTTETPEPLRAPADHDEMLTLFLPLAPNPVMGGHLVHLPTDRVMDVDLTVEEGLRAVLTSGVAVGEPADGDEQSRRGHPAEDDAVTPVAGTTRNGKHDRSD